MQTVPTHPYHAQVTAWIHQHHDTPDLLAQLDQHAEAVQILLSLDLEPARALLQRCYAARPRGGRPWDPIVVLRCLLLALIIGIPSINKLVPALRGSRVLRVLAGLPDAVAEGGSTAPGVGTFYDFLSRLHDGPLPRDVRGYVRPSVAERKAARTQRAPGNEPLRPKKKKGRVKGTTPTDEPSPHLKVSERTLKEVRASRTQRLPDDLLGRLSELLWALAVRPSAERGLLGDLHSLVVTGDGSPLVTGACGLGTRSCTCNPRKPCACLRTYADPDARSGWDAYRKRYFFGHHFYEVSVPWGGHDLPMMLRLDPGNTSDFSAGLLTLERVQKTLRDQTDGWRIDRYIADAGHDAGPTYELCADHQIRPVIPLNQVPAVHPTRPTIKLSPRAIPLCEASVEMAAWGSGGPGRPAFVCPVKAGKIARCPKAPAEQPDWLCQPESKVGPVVNLATSDDPRLFPVIQRNSATYEESYSLRTGCERSNSMKKVRFKLEAARHRRASFWLIRLHLIAVLQHALVWVSDEDARRSVRKLLTKAAPALP